MDLELGATATYIIMMIMFGIFAFGLAYIIFYDVVAIYWYNMAITNGGSVVLFDFLSTHYVWGLPFLFVVCMIFYSAIESQREIGGSSFNVFGLLLGALICNVILMLVWATQYGMIYNYMYSLVGYYGGRLDIANGIRNMFAVAPYIIQLAVDAVAVIGTIMMEGEVYRVA
jgi:hypothetical protein